MSYFIGSSNSGNIGNATELQGYAISATAPSNGYALVYSTTSSSYVPTLVGGSFSAGGDLTGTTTSQQVVSATGSGGTLSLATTAASISWASGTTSPQITQVTPGSVATPQSITIAPQAPNGGSGTAAQNTPGSLIVSVPAPGSTGTAGAEAGIILKRAGTNIATIAALSGAASFGTIWLGSTAPNGGTNCAINSDGAVTTNVNAVTQVNFNVSGTTIIRTTSSVINCYQPITFDYTLGSPEVSQNAKTSDVATANLTIQSQAPYASAVTHQTAGNIVLNIPPTVGAATSTGQIQFEYNGALIGQLGVASTSSTIGTFWLGSSGFSAGANNFTLQVGSSNVALNAPSGSGTVYLGVGASYPLQITSSAIAPQINALTWVSSATGPTISQSTPGSVSTPSNISINPQAPNGGSGSAAQNTPGSLIVNVSAPGSTGTAGNEAGLIFQRAGTQLLQLSALVGSTAYGAIYFGNITPSSSNYAFNSNGTAGLVINTPTSQPLTIVQNGGTVGWQFNGGTITETNTLAAPTITQTTPASVATPNNFTIQPQAPNGGSGSAAQNTPGSLIVNVSAPGSTGTAGNEAGLIFQRGGTTYTQLSAWVGTTSYSAIYMGSFATSPSSSNATLISGADTFLNAPGANTLHLRVNNSDYMQFASSLITPTQATMQWGTGYNPIITQTTESITTGRTFTVKAANATGASSSGGDLVLASGTGTSTDGYVQINVGGNNEVLQLGATSSDFISFGTTPAQSGFLRFGYDASNLMVMRNSGNTADIPLIITGAYEGDTLSFGDSQSLNASILGHYSSSSAGSYVLCNYSNSSMTVGVTGGQFVYFTSNNGSYGNAFSIKPQDTSSTVLSFGPNVTSASITTTAQASTSSGSGVAGITTTISAQAGQAATGASNNGGNGGNLVLASGIGGTSGSASAGADGYVQLNVGGNFEALQLGGTTSDFISMGAMSNIAQSGYIRLPNAASNNIIMARNSGNTADMTVLSTPTNRTIQIGDGTNCDGITLETSGATAAGIMLRGASTANGHAYINIQDDSPRIVFQSVPSSAPTPGIIFTDNFASDTALGLICVSAGATSIMFGEHCTSSTIFQAIYNSTGSNAGVTMTIQAQQGQAQTGATNNNNGGNLVLSSGLAGTGGSGTAGATGNVNLQLGGVTAFSVTPSNIIVGLTETKNNADGYTNMYQDIAHTTTSSAATNNIFTWTIPTDTCTQMDCTITAAQLSGGHTTAVAAFKLAIMIMNDNGAITLGTLHNNQSDSTITGISGSNVSITNSSTTGEITVTGSAGLNIAWSVVASRIETIS